MEASTAWDVASGWFSFCSQLQPKNVTQKEPVPGMLVDYEESLPILTMAQNGGVCL
jgi:hypothetical protein